MKDKMLLLHELSKSTIGCRPRLQFLKNGFQVLIERTPPASDYKSPLFNDPEKAIDDAIWYIESRQRKTTFNDIKGTHAQATHTIEKELSL